MTRSLNSPLLNSLPNSPRRNSSWLNSAVFSLCLVVGFGLMGSARLGAQTAGEGDSQWSRFRGPNGSGVADTEGLPIEFGPDKNVAWKTALPPGHSSPVLTKSDLFVTGFEGDELLTLCLDRRTGEIRWRRGVRRARNTNVDSRADANGYV